MVTGSGHEISEPISNSVVFSFQQILWGNVWINLLSFQLRVKKQGELVSVTEVGNQYKRWINRYSKLYVSSSWCAYA